MGDVSTNYFKKHMRAIWLQFILLSDLEVLAKSFLLFRESRGFLVEGRLNCSSLEVPENFKASCSAAEITEKLLALKNRLRSEKE